MTWERITSLTFDEAADRAARAPEERAFYAARPEELIQAVLDAVWEAGIFSACEDEILSEELDTVARRAVMLYVESRFCGVNPSEEDWPEAKWTTPDGYTFTEEAYQ